MKKIIFFIVLSALLFTGCRGSSNGVEPAVENNPPDPPVISDEEEVVSEPIMENDDLYAVVIDNNPSARPQTGLHQAQRIYELPVEGGITRFLAFFRYEAAEKIGPVRSAREDFVDLLLPYDSSFAHCGGSTTAVQRIRQEIRKDICEVHNSPFAFYRDNTRKAPHNLYTSTELLNDAYKQRGFIKESHFIFEDTLDGQFSEYQHKTVEIDYFRSSWYNYRFSYEYDPETKLYSRYTNGSPHTLKDADPLQTRGAVFIVADLSPQPNGHVFFQTLGENDAYIFYEGKHLKTTWRRNSKDDHFTFLVDGDYIEINNPGFIFHIIDKSKNVVID